MRALLLCLLSVPALAADPVPGLLLAKAELTIALIPLKAPLWDAAVKKSIDPVAKKGGWTAEVKTVARADYGGLADDSLQYTAADLTPADREKVAAAANVVSLWLQWPLDDGSRLKDIYAVVERLAAGGDALIFDRNNSNVYAVKEWHRRRLEKGWDGSLASGPWHVQVHMVPQDNGLIMLDTGGMPRFGIADFELLNVARSAVDPAGELVNLVGQRLIEGARPDKRGRLKVAIADLRDGAMKKDLMSRSYDNARHVVVVGFAKGDVTLGARDDALELTFPEIKCADRGLCLDAALKQLFGSTDSVQNVEHDEKVLKAKAKALADLKPYQAKVKQGLPHGEILMVKARFPWAEGNEWMWVDVHAWEGTTLKGTLENEPEYVTNLKAGATVEVKLEDVMDYIYKYSDDTFFGNETGRVLKPQIFEPAGGGKFKIKR